MTDQRWQMVTCTECGRTYQCTPSDDNYGGLCTKCLVGDLRVVDAIERLPAEEGGYVLCRVEGCPRTTDDGQNRRCGLARLAARMALPIDAMDSSLCGSNATVDAWIDAGLLDIAPHISHDVHHAAHREGLTP